MCSAWTKHCISLHSIARLLNLYLICTAWSDPVHTAYIPITQTQPIVPGLRPVTDLGGLMASSRDLHEREMMNEHTGGLPLKAISSRPIYPCYVGLLIPLAVCLNSQHHSDSCLTLFLQALGTFFSCTLCGNSDSVWRMWVHVSVMDMGSLGFRFC